MKSAEQLITEERERLLMREGLTAERADGYAAGELSLAAIAYYCAHDCHFTPQAGAPDYWPWGKHRFLPTTRLRNSVKAAALVRVELERLARLEAEMVRSINEQLVEPTGGGGPSDCAHQVAQWH